MKKTLKKLFKKEKIASQPLLPFFSRKSYSQTGEDLIIKFIFDTININKPSYLDIGAHHPYILSNTALLNELGSIGINVEPDPVLFDAFLKYREGDINLNIGVSNIDGVEDFYIISNPVLNTFSKSEAEKYKLEGDFVIKKVIKLKTKKVQSIISNYAKNKFPEFLNVDAEGIDEIIIDSIDFKTNFPIVICIETISFSNSGRGIKNLRLIKKIEDAGYINFADTYINTIFVRKESWIR
ncbi:MAG: hypothetical protein ACJA1Z_000420 [Patiriisocius sp.]|jgi:hypothetical protein